MFFIPEDHWEVRSVAKKGKGVFAKKDLESGIIIGDYIGKVIRQAEVDDVEEEGHFYLMYYTQRSTIEPNLRKPGLHLFNHSCTPNVWMYTYRRHALYFALRKIFAGEELTVNYLLDPQTKYCKPCNHLCHCHSIICSGTMHMTQEQFDKWNDYNEEIAAKTTPGRFRYGKELPLLKEYPTSIEDNAMYTLFGSPVHSSETVNASTLPSTMHVRKLIRESGRTLKFPALNLQVLGVKNDIIYTKSL